MPDHIIPEFLKGTFCWTSKGYSYAERPTVNLLTAEALASDNPWVRLAAVLERAKTGDHSQIARLGPFLRSIGSDGPQRAAIHLIGDAGSEAELSELKAVLEEGTDPLRAYAAEAAELAGRLSLVLPMVTAWKRVASRDHHETIGYAISSLLEAPGGSIAANAGIYNADPVGASRIENPAMRAMAERRAADQSKTEFEDQVLARLADVRQKYGERALIWHGEPFNVQVFAEQMNSLVRDQASGPIQGLFISMRHKFEATTGIDCSACYRKGALQPLNAAEILETFLDGKTFNKYEEDVRYFFGHRIPD